MARYIHAENRARLIDALRSAELSEVNKLAEEWGVEDVGYWYFDRLIAEMARIAHEKDRIPTDSIEAQANGYVTPWAGG